MTPPAARVEPRGTCDVPGCGRRHYGRGYCRAHHARWARHGDPHAERPIQPTSTTTAAGRSYGAVHRRLRVERGPATRYGCADCAGPAAVWSHIGGGPDERTDPRGLRYSLDLDRYRPRCRSCHRRATAPTRPDRPAAGRAVSDPDRVIRLYRAGASGPGIAALLGVSRTAIYTALRAHGQPLRPRGTRAQPITDTQP